MREDTAFLRWIRWLLPGYAIAPLGIALLVNGLGYFGIQQLQGYLHFYDFSTALDHALPFVPGFMYIYVLAFVQWTIGFLACGREGQTFCYRYMSAELVAKMITLACFIILPSTIARPQVTGSGLTALLSNIVYGADAPINLFPSIHCLESYFCLRVAWKQKKTGRVYPWITSVFALLVFASVVLVKQHVVIDIAGGILVFELGLFLTRRHDFSRIYRKLELKI